MSDIQPGFQTQEYFDEKIKQCRDECAGLAALLADARVELQDLKTKNQDDIATYVRAIATQRNSAMDYAADLMIQIERLNKKIHELEKSK